MTEARRLRAFRPVILAVDDDPGGLERVERDEKGYVMTGTDLLHGGGVPEGWTLARAPMILETSVPGVFAAGDVRHGSTRRVASAVGEGSIVIRLVHGYLEESAELAGR